MARVQMLQAAGRPSLQLGRGIDTSTGAACGIAVIPDEPKVDNENSGQMVWYSVELIETSEDLQESLGISAGADFRYGLFSAEGKFSLQNQSQFKSFATYLLAKCDVVNPPIGLFDPTAKPDAQQIVNQPQKFKRAFGDAFVRSATTGGQLYILLEIIHEETSVQKSIGASIQAEYNGFLVGASINFAMSDDTKQKASKSQLRVLQYQAAGQGVQCSLVDNVEETLTRLKSFPQIALDHPVRTGVEVVTYDVIPALIGDPWLQAALEDALDDCSRKRMRFKQIADELDFLLTGNNKQYFENPPDDDIAQNAKATYLEQMNKVVRHADQLVRGAIEPVVYEEPHDLPIVRLVRKPSPPEAAMVIVPDVSNMKIAQALASLTAVGLNGVPRSQAVADDDARARDVIIAQDPGAQLVVPKNSQVELTYLLKSSQLIKKLVFAHDVNLLAINKALQAARKE